MKSLRSLGLPLQIALAISPLYWLLDINLVRRELDRGALLKVSELIVVFLRTADMTSPGQG
jgi:hypothetical protein